MGGSAVSSRHTEGISPCSRVDTLLLASEHREGGGEVEGGGGGGGGRMRELHIYVWSYDCVLLASARKGKSCVVMSLLLNKKSDIII